MQTLVPLAIRRLAPALLLAAAATLGANPATASAEWDIGQYDNCMNNAIDMEMAGDITPLERDYEFIRCCFGSGGVVDGGVPGGCGAPPAVAASDTPSAPSAVNADPDVDAGSAPKPTKKPPTKLPTLPDPDPEPAPVG
ncbi:hypothetical protein [Mycolicibacterium stellerae]|uniref:hypothetical protein n=1 Tax=Mycolicibacterium stellerae TaxID=2358193 RepID=UPI000F0B081F|nr:hypothetical protein [Mycolicibacterium stellerae]